MTMPDPLLVFAMKEESQDVFDDYRVLHTGIGKVNASYALTAQIAHQRPPMVINMGTAGSRTFEGGAIVNPNRFIQRDMNVTALGFDLYQTPFSDDPLLLEYGEVVKNLPQGICGTGDSFDVSEGASQFDVVDMEAYALALICRRENIPFLCLKYISDGANDNAHEDWYTALHRTAEKLKLTLEEVLQ